jgi:hypothetical protein
MKHRCAALCTLVAALALAVLPLDRALAFPEPAIVSPSWNLDLEVQTPRPIAVQDTHGVTRWYWYMPYRVTNRTGDDQLFIPEVTIFTDTGRIIRAGHNVPASVYEAVRRQINNPLLELPVEVVGRILQGEDHARESIAVWPHFESDVDEFHVFFAGTSGETQSIDMPGGDEPVLVRRTHQYTYRTPGNYPTPQNQPIHFVEHREVMR